jgi:predicted transcriptional regulator
MKTAISIPEAIFRRAERLARRLKKSRSQLYSEAVAEYVQRRDPDELRQAVDAALAGLSVPESEFVARASRRTLKRADW